MKSSVALILGTATAAAAVFYMPIHAQDRESAQSEAVTYKPPLRGAPLTRVGGGTRSVGNALAVNVLAPSDTGLTTQEKPTIYWFASQPIDKPVELAITTTESLQAAATPVFEITLQPPLAKGIHAFRLGDHGVSLKPGKPTILAVCNGKPVFGLPGNPVSCMVTFDLFVAPTLATLSGANQPPQRSVTARLARNIASATGREDYIQVRLEDGLAIPVFGKSNLIYTLIRADGMLKVPLDVGGLSAGSEVEVVLF